MAAANQFPKLRERGEATQGRTQDNIASTLTPIATALNATPIMGALPPPWIQPLIVVASGFVEAGGGALGSGRIAHTSFHKDALGYVHMRLAVSTAAGAAANTAIFVVPGGYRPSDFISLTASNFAGTAVRTISVEPDGNVRTLVAIAAAGDIVGYFTYLAER